MRKHIRHLRQTFIDFSLRTKLILFFALLMASVTIIVMAATYVVIADEYEETVFRSADLAFSQAQEFTMQTVWPMIYASDTLYYNAQIQQTLSEAARNFSQDISVQYREMQQMQNVLYPQNRPMQGINVRLYVDPAYVFAGQDVYFSSLADLQEAFARQENRPREQYYWLAPEELVLKPNEAPTRIVSLLREMRNPDNYQERIGAIRVCIDAEKLNDIITKADISQQGVAFFINMDREIIAASNFARLQELNTDQGGIYELLTARHVDWEQISLNGGNYIIRNAAIAETDWEMVAIIPAGEIKQPSRRIAAFMAVIMFTAIVIASISVFLFSEWFTKRMRRLAKQMVNVRSGNLDIVLQNDDLDEVGMLYDSFNYMLLEMQKLMEQQYESGKAIKNAELKALQAQINPHFLYNTLDLINWKAIQSGDLEAARIAQKLARFYKLSLKSGADIVTVEDELKHVKTYVEIQNCRFENRILLTIDIPEEICRNSIPKIVMQPLVENSILHGILKKDYQSQGEIRISARIVETMIEIRIADDGIGMGKERMDNILKPSEQNKPGQSGNNQNENEQNGHGYGVKNINMRLKLNYGDVSGLSYYSVVGEGTVVTIRIPQQNTDNGIEGEQE